MKQRTDKLLTLLQSHHHKGWLIVTVHDLRHVLGVQGMYQGFANFNRGVLIPAINQLRSRGVFITCSPQRKRRGIGKGVKIDSVHLVFQLPDGIIPTNNLKSDTPANQSSPTTCESLREFEQRIEQNC